MSDHHIVAVDQILPARLFRRIIIPSRNQRDLEEIPGHVHRASRSTWRTP